MRVTVFVADVPESPVREGGFGTKALLLLLEQGALLRSRRPEPALALR